MVDRRGRSTGLCDGPGKLTQALGVDLAYDGHDLTGGRLALSWGEPPEEEIVSTTRIGISQGVDLPWRYLIEGKTNVSVAPKTVAERGLRRSG